MARAFLLHRSKFQRNYADDLYSVCRGALVVFTNGRYWYHDGTDWSPAEGLSAQQWIKMFHVGVPLLEDDEFGIVTGLTDDHRVLDDVFTQKDVRECLNAFLAKFPEEYAVWPEGEILLPLAKARILSAKRRHLNKAAVTSVESTNHRHHRSPRRQGRIAKSARISLIS